MKIPKKPIPKIDDIAEKCTDFAHLHRILACGPTGPDDRYLHWENLEHYTPPDSLSHEQWWLGLKTARGGLYKTIPLDDVHGRPFRFCTPDPALSYLHRIDQALAGNVGIPEEARTRDAQHRYLVRSLIEEAITSSQLEGAATTRKVAREMIRTGRPPVDSFERMILNNYQTMMEVRKLKDRPLSVSMLLELQRMLTEGTLDHEGDSGRLRCQDDDDIRVVDSEDGTVLHSPPKASRLPERLKTLCTFANRRSYDFFLHPVVKAIVLHFWLAYDHPFVDGNGRCARALFYWSMLRDDYWVCEYLTISTIIRKARARYGRAFLYTETDENDLTYFILYHLKVIVRAIEEFKSYVIRKTKQVRSVEGLLRKSVGLNYREQALLAHAIRHPDAEYTVRSHCTSHNITGQTARSDLQMLHGKGLLRKKRIGRQHVFRPAPDLEKRLQAL